MRIRDAYDVYRRAERAERRARDIEQNGSDLYRPCHSHFDPKLCRCCTRYAACVGNDAPSLFDAAWRGYRKAETLARWQVKSGGGEDAAAMLARILISIHIHPNSGLEQDTEALWESQYLWLRLYFSTRRKGYMSMARLCEGFRSAYAVRADETEE